MTDETEKPHNSPLAASDFCSTWPATDRLNHKATGPMHRQAWAACGTASNPSVCHFTPVRLAGGSGIGRCRPLTHTAQVRHAVKYRLFYVKRSRSPQSRQARRNPETCGGIFSPRRLDCRGRATARRPAQHPTRAPALTSGLGAERLTPKVGRALVRADVRSTRIKGTDRPAIASVSGMSERPTTRSAWHPDSRATALPWSHPCVLPSARPLVLGPSHHLSSISAGLRDSPRGRACHSRALPPCGEDPLEHHPCRRVLLAE